MKIRNIVDYSDELLSVVVMVFVATIFMAIMGCDETQQMVKPIVGEVMEPADEKPTPPTTIGEVKKPKEETLVAVRVSSQQSVRVGNCRLSVCLAVRVGGVHCLNRDLSD